MDLTRQLSLRAYFDNYSGFGILGTQLFFELRKYGYTVYSKPIAIAFKDSTFKTIVSKEYTDIVRAKKDADMRLNELLCVPAPLVKERLPNYKNQALLTMWDASVLPFDYVQRMNGADTVIVPSTWNLEVFKASGVTKPIYVCPLGVDTSVFAYHEPDLNSDCVFGVGGRLAVGGVRKNLAAAIRAFKKAFPQQQDVRLEIKLLPDESIKFEPDLRITVVDRYMEKPTLANWYRNLTCFVTTSHGEAFGLMPLEAMASGRPVLAPLYGGLLEYFNATVGFPVDHSITPAFGLYADCEDASWATLSDDSLIEQMRFVYNNRGLVATKGLASAEHAQQFSWKNTVTTLDKILQSELHNNSVRVQQTLLP